MAKMDYKKEYKRLYKAPDEPWPPKCHLGLFSVTCAARHMTKTLPITKKDVAGKSNVFYIVTTPIDHPPR